MGDPGAPSYYDVPMLKVPVWTWEVPAYFFLGGVSAGAFVLARLARRFGGASRRDLARAGTTVAALALLPCPPLLIKDLGDPRRLHHMLRVFKPRSPMNLGSWTLTAYGGIVALALLREWRGKPGDSPAGAETIVLDAAGIPLALLLAGYTGVLLSATSTPVWSGNVWLGPLFSASALHAGASAVELAMEAGSHAAEDGALARMHGAGRFVEAIGLAGYLLSAGRFADPLTRGELAPHLWGGAVGAGLALPELLGHLPARGKARRWLRIASSALSLLGGFALRWAVVAAGRPSANDPDAARAASRPR